MTENTYAPTAEQLEALVRCLLPKIQKFFDSQAGKQEFEQWKAERQQAA